MKSKNKSLFLCVLALFAIAILLIVVSSVQDFKIKPSDYLNDEQVYSSALQQNAAQLVEESDRIKTENEKLKKSLEEKEAELALLRQDLQQYQQASDNSDFLVAAATKFINNRFGESFNFFQNVNAAILSAPEKDLYTQLQTALSIKGFDVANIAAQ